jgi:hypothetical protein
MLIHHAPIADGIMFNQPNTTTDLWITRLQEWQQSGEKGKPPGVGLTEPTRLNETTEYYLSSPVYMLRPEVTYYWV